MTETKQVDEIDSHIPSLERIFESYCSFGEPTNTTELKSSKWIKLLRDSLIVKPVQERGQYPLSLVEADLLFAKVANRTPKKGKKGKKARPQTATLKARLTFDQFIEALGILSDTLYKTIEYPTSYLTLLNEYILPLCE